MNTGLLAEVLGELDIYGKGLSYQETAAKIAELYNFKQEVTDNA